MLTTTSAPCVFGPQADLGALRTEEVPADKGPSLTQAAPTPAIAVATPLKRRGISRLYAEMVMPGAAPTGASPMRGVRQLADQLRSGSLNGKYGDLGLPSRAASEIGAVRLGLFRAPPAAMSGQASSTTSTVPGPRLAPSNQQSMPILQTVSEQQGEASEAACCSESEDAAQLYDSAKVPDPSETLKDEGSSFTANDANQCSDITLGVVDSRGDTGSNANTGESTDSQALSIVVGHDGVAQALDEGSDMVGDLGQSDSSNSLDKKGPDCQMTDAGIASQVQQSQKRTRARVKTSAVRVNDSLDVSCSGSDNMLQLEVSGIVSQDIDKTCADQQAKSTEPIAPKELQEIMPDSVMLAEVVKANAPKDSKCEPSAHQHDQPTESLEVLQKIQVISESPPSPGGGKEQAPKSGACKRAVPAVQEPEASARCPGFLQEHLGAEPDGDQVASPKAAKRRRTTDTGEMDTTGNVDVAADAPEAAEASAPVADEVEAEATTPKASGAAKPKRLPKAVAKVMAMKKRERTQYLQTLSGAQQLKLAMQMSLAEVSL